MNRKADRIRRTHASVESSRALKGRELRSFRPFPASAEPSPLEHSLGEIALLPATGGPAPVFQANPNRAEIVPDNQVPGMTIQAKLMIGAPGDRFEQEADRVATQVVRQIQEPKPQAPVREQAVQREEIQGKDHQVESRPMSVNAPSGVITRSAPPHLEPSIHQARGGGQPLPNPIRVPMEQAFGADFSGVRIHADAGSDELARSIQAEAFTTGRDVYFRQGAYEPRSRGGQELLAHELTHVVQQLPHDQKHLVQVEAGASGGNARLNFTSAYAGQGVVQRSPNIKVVGQKKPLDLGAPTGRQAFVNHVVVEGNKTDLMEFYTKLKQQLSDLKITIGAGLELQNKNWAIGVIEKAIKVRESRKCKEEDFPSPGTSAIATTIASTTGFQVVGEKPAKLGTTMEQVVTGLGMKSGKKKYDPEDGKVKACWIHEFAERVTVQVGPSTGVLIHMTFFMDENNKTKPVTKGNYETLFKKIHITAELNTGYKENYPRFYFLDQVRAWTPPTHQPPLSNAAVKTIQEKRG